MHRVKAVIAPYLLYIQYKADDGTVGKLFRDQCTDREWHLVNIRPLAGIE